MRVELIDLSQIVNEIYVTTLLETGNTKHNKFLILSVNRETKLAKMYFHISFKDNLDFYFRRTPPHFSKFNKRKTVLTPSYFPKERLMSLIFLHKYLYIYKKLNFRLIQRQEEFQQTSIYRRKDRIMIL